MRMKPFALLVAATALMLGLAACGQLNGPVAVLDLNRVVKESGLLAQANNQLAASRQKLRQQMGQVKSQLSTQLAKAKEGLGKKPSKEKQAEYDKEVREANRRLVRARAQAARYMSNLQSRLQAWMRQQVRPVARQVADAKGMKLVLLAGNGLVLDHDTSLDITDQVVAELRRGGSGSPPQVQVPQPGQAEAPAQPAKTKPATTK